MNVLYVLPIMLVQKTQGRRHTYTYVYYVIQMYCTHIMYIVYVHTHILCTHTHRIDTIKLHIEEHTHIHTHKGKNVMSSKVHIKRTHM